MPITSGFQMIYVGRSNCKKIYITVNDILKSKKITHLLFGPLKKIYTFLHASTYMRSKHSRIPLKTD